MQMALLEDIDDFLALGDTMNMAFSKRYGVYFDPLLWGITPIIFWFWSGSR